jgi:hypothetical protein
LILFDPSWIKVAYNKFNKSETEMEATIEGEMPLDMANILMGHGGALSGQDVAVPLLGDVALKDWGPSEHDMWVEPNLV